MADLTPQRRLYDAMCRLKLTDWFPEPDRRRRGSQFSIRYRWAGWQHMWYRAAWHFRVMSERQSSKGRLLFVDSVQIAEDELSWMTDDALVSYLEALFFMSSMTLRWVMTRRVDKARWRRLATKRRRRIYGPWHRPTGGQCRAHERQLCPCGQCRVSRRKTLVGKPGKNGR